jgi:NAD+ kinase
MVVSPRSVLAVEVLHLSGAPSRPADGQDETAAAVLWCDGRRRVDLPGGARVEVRRGTQPVLLARLTGPGQEQADGVRFTDRLVAKFGLPVAGWRGSPATRRRANGQRTGTAGDRPGTAGEEDTGA